MKITPKILQSTYLYQRIGQVGKIIEKIGVPLLIQFIRSKHN